MFLGSSTSRLHREVALRDREASLLEREAALARQSVTHLLREATLQTRENINRDINRRVIELQPRSSGEWAAFARYNEETDRYGQALIAAIRGGFPPPRPPPRLVFERAVPSDMPGRRPLAADHRGPHRVEYDSDSSSDSTANSSSEMEDDPDQWGGMPPPPA